MNNEHYISQTNSYDDNIYAPFFSCCHSLGKLYSSYTLKVNKAIHKLEDAPTLLQELLSDLDSLEQIADTVKSRSSTSYTQLCNYIYGFKLLQRQLQNALVVGMIHDTS